MTIKEVFIIMIVLFPMALALGVLTNKFLDLLKKQ